MNAGVPARSFFEALWRDQSGYAEIRALHPPRKRAFFEHPPKLAAFLRHAAELSGRTNVYFGGGLRRAPGSGKNKDVAALGAVWLDIDFRAYKGGQPEVEERIRQVTARYPASAAVHSGGGYNVYWFLKEPAGPDAFDSVATVNRALARIVGGDRVADPARILRFPGTVNTKYDHRPIAHVSQFHPERRYNVPDFDELIVEDDAPPRPRAAGGATPPRRRSLTETQKAELVEIIRKIWVRHNHHNAALYLSGLMAKNGFPLEDLEEILAMVCALTGDREEADRIRAAQDTYQKFEAGENVAGYSQLAELVKRFPKEAQAHAAKALRLLDWKMRGGQGRGRRGQDPGSLDLLGRLKVHSIAERAMEQPEYVVRYELDGKSYVCTVDGEQLLSFRAFKQSMLKQNRIILSGELADGAWQTLIENLQIKQDPSASAGEKPLREIIKDTIIDILRSRGTVDDLEELTSNTVFHNETRVYFKWDCLTVGLRGRGARYQNRDVQLALVELGATHERFSTSGLKYWTIPKAIVTTQERPQAAEGEPSRQQEFFGTDLDTKN